MRGVLVLAALALAACAVTATEPEETSMREIVRGYHSQQRTQLFEYVTDAERLNTLWRQHGSSARPTIDFAESAVLALFLGERTTGGYAVIVERVTRRGAILEVDVTVYEPGRGCMTTQALTQPFQFVEVPAGATEARFNTRRIAEPCE